MAMAQTATVEPTAEQRMSGRIAAIALHDPCPRTQGAMRRAEMERVTARAVDEYPGFVSPEDEQAARDHLARVMDWCDGVLG